MDNKHFLTLLLLLFMHALKAQPRIPLPAAFRATHPRLEADSVTDVDQLRAAIDTYVNRHQSDPSWIVSRLQMYWTTKATDVFIKGGVYDHAAGAAPVPTVRFPGARDHVTVYAAPKLEDMLPYADDPRGVYLVNKSKAGQPLEWAEISKTGRIIESINNAIMGMARTAARLYRFTSEEKYARFAFDILDTYMTGMYYRSTPKDLMHGHHETIAGLSTFEVIQEAAILSNITGTYDDIYNYISFHCPEKRPLYETTLRKWADVQIAQGVAFNNWNLIEAGNILNIATLLEDNNRYQDRKGRQYYIDFVLNRNTERQWSISKLLSEGYDPQTGIWYESPGYSMVVLRDFTNLVSLFDRRFNHDILPAMPVLEKAVPAAAQYLFPNGYHAAFGDSHYGRLASGPAQQLLSNARMHHKTEQEKVYTKYIKALNALNDQTGRIDDYVSPVFSAPNASYFALRNGMHPVNGLMVAMSGSKGNHMHAGGIAMEIFGKGLILGPESGIGTSYFQPDYAEYYSQFPAHNTVAVDGISAYPVMKSNHAFEVKSCYPASGLMCGYFPAVSFGELYFLEPETQSDQLRLISIIRINDSTGYYVDIFRSKRRDGKDNMHDYFYHNMGQQLTLTDTGNKLLRLQPTGQLSFGGGNLSAYDYFWDKRSLLTAADVKATFSLSIPGQEEVRMNMWMKGDTNRQFFTVKAPMSKAIDRMGLPAEIAELPLPTVIMRQQGEAWTKPFVAVFEPSTASQPAAVRNITAFHPADATADFVGLSVIGRNGDKQYIYSNATAHHTITDHDRSFEGTYGVISETATGIAYLFLGNGKAISKGEYKLTAEHDHTAAALCHENGRWYFTASAPVTLSLPAAMMKGKKSIRLPAMSYSEITF